MKPIALITGAARGIGKGIALSLARHGFDIVAADMRFDDPEAFQSEIEAAGARCSTITCDISQTDRSREVIAEAVSVFGGLHCLINNAGVSVLSRSDMLEVTPAAFDHCMDINLRGTFFLTQAAARYFLSSEAPSLHRSIVTITSSNAAMASVNRSEYCVSKAGLSMASQLFAIRLAGHGIGVYEIRPGFIATEMTAAAAPGYQHLFENGFVPQGRWGTPADIGRACAVLASGGMAYSTGSALTVDGGMHVAHY